ncbi:WD repeat-containing protein 44-like [Impatiens glandulifera]|uniref:WD repeat-containing protein 44-like n=1 Tax=Impatiens glandulifera TaxID=253017 RepID=UPI001FB120E1|nr:WD repeat-containing protein 44-like [Impatiens glandulifera]
MMVMNSFSEEEEQFFDSREEITSVSEFESDCSEDCSPSPRWDKFGYESWAKNLDASYEQRRSRFMNWMGSSGLEQEIKEGEESNNVLNNEVKIGIDRVGEDSGTVLRDSYLEDRVLSSLSSMTTCCSAEDAELSREEDDLLKIRNLDNGMEFLMADGISRNSSFNGLRQVGTDKLITSEEFQKTFGSSSLVQRLLRRKEEEANNLVDLKKKVKKSWFKKFGSKNSSTTGTGIQRVQVHAYKKNRKELSSLLKGQEIQAHDGAILAMKFSHDGKYLATGGEDGVVRIWKVIDDEEDDNVDDESLNHHFDIQQTDPSCLYLSVNHLSKLVSLDSNKDKTNNGGGGKSTRKMKKSSESACVILPPKVFKITEEPLHEFRGHCGEILALSWSTKGYLLSSSIDETVRLWRVGQHQCLEVFSHNNYVTSIEFNPVDDNYFISGSIDGKVRIWKVHGCKVVDWIDVKEIVTAVCYYPSGNGGVIGSMDGSCRFYDIVGNQFKLDDHVCLQGKKKSPCKRITGFEFSPDDPNKLLVTSADSQVRLINGHDVMYKFKSSRVLGSQVTASFTSDGKRVISASEEHSSIHVWNFMGQEGSPPHPKKVKKIFSSESFSSTNASIAIPWCGRKTTAIGSPQQDDLAKCMSGNEHFIEELCQRMESASPDCLLSLRRAFLLDSLTKGTATWPEEKLPVNAAVTAPKISRSEYKFFKSACQNSSTSHMWGLVMVAGGWDGRIRTYYNYGLPVRA